MTAKPFALAAFLLCLSGAASAAIIWTGPNVTFTHAANTTTADFLTANVSITRGATQGIFNSTSETAYATNVSPAGTQWAFQGLNGNPGTGVTAANFASLTFSSWETSLGGGPALQGNIANRPGVIHLVADDIYLNVLFTSWGGGGTGGAFTYVRTSPVPVPAAGWLLVSGLGTLLLRRRG